MIDYKMTCKCFLCYKGYKIGRKYVTIYDARDGKTLKKCELSDDIKTQLAKVKEKYPQTDAQRVDMIEDIVDTANGILIY